MNSMEDYRIRKSDGKICAAWMIPAAFAAGTLFGMLAMGFLAANFTEAYNPCAEEKAQEGWTEERHRLPRQICRRRVMPSAADFRLF